MKAVVKGTGAICFLLLMNGCAFVNNIDHPAALIKVSDPNSADRVDRILLAPVDFFDERSRDVVTVCGKGGWESGVGKNGSAVFKRRTSTRFLNFLSSQSVFDNLDEMYRGIAVCAKRASGKVEYLTTVEGSAMTFGAGAELDISCNFVAEEWQCTSSLG